MRKIRYSKDVDALLIELSDKPIDHAEESGRFILHFAKDGEPVLLEILDAKEFVINIWADETPHGKMHANFCTLKLSSDHDSSCFVHGNPGIDQ